MKLEISNLVAIVMQRVISEEIENQKRWQEDDFDGTRTEIIKQLEQLSDDIEKQGVKRYWRA